MGLLSSKGIKRYTATVLSTALVFAAGVPVLGPVVSVLFGLNGVLGAVGVAHGVASKSVASHAPATIGAALALVYALAENSPACAPYLPLIQLLMTAMGGYTVAKGVTPSAPKSRPKTS